MKTSHAALSVVASLAIVADGFAQADQKALEAVQQLIAAGNYSWRESRETDVNGRISREARGSGRTIIDGFTIATLGGIKFVALADDTAFELRSGWRLTRDFTAADLQELKDRRAPFSGIVTVQRGNRRYVHAGAHDVLRWLVRHGWGFFEHEGAIMADIPVGLETELQLGLPPSKAAPPSLFGVRPPGKGTSGAARPGPSDGTLKIWLTDGQVSKFSAEFTRSSRPTSDPGSGATRTSTRVYMFELSAVGTTRVDVPPEAKALFPSRAARR